MRAVSDQSWSRRGLSLLWGAESLSRIAHPNQVVSVRQPFALSRAWPEDLPAVEGNTVVVAGVDGCLDALGPEDAAQWLEEDFRRIVVGFQDRYENQAALILWIPDSRRRIAMPRATEEYEWHCSGRGTQADFGAASDSGRRATHHGPQTEGKWKASLRDTCGQKVGNEPATPRQSRGSPGASLSTSPKRSHERATLTRRWR
jgi:hypothetical protein